MLFQWIGVHLLHLISHVGSTLVIINFDALNIFSFKKGHQQWALFPYSNWCPPATYAGQTVSKYKHKILRTIHFFSTFTFFNSLPSNVSQKSQKFLLLSSKAHCWCNFGSPILTSKAGVSKRSRFKYGTARNSAFPPNPQPPGRVCNETPTCSECLPLVQWPLAWMGYIAESNLKLPAKRVLAEGIIGVRKLLLLLHTGFIGAFGRTSSTWP